MFVAFPRTAIAVLVLVVVFWGLRLWARWYRRHRRKRR